MTGAATALLGAAAVGSGVMAGVLGAFSDFVMPALGRLPEDGGAAAMRAINTTAVRPPLMIALFGTAAAAVAAAATVLVQGQGASAVLTLAGTTSYLVGVLGVTVLANVPLNDRLAASSDPYWAEYRRRWTGWNHLRTGAALASAAAFTVAVAG
jgi:uncharacterized membrane protein